MTSVMRVPRSCLKNELEEFKWTVEDYIKAGEENAVDQLDEGTENASARHHILPGGNEASDAAARRAALSTEFEGA